MAQYRFNLVARHRPEILERLLRVIRHRGFIVIKMDMELIEDKVQIQFAVKSERALELLLNQLEKLPDVVEIGKQ